MPPTPAMPPLVVWRRRRREGYWKRGLASVHCESLDEAGRKKRRKISPCCFPPPAPPPQAKRKAAVTTKTDELQTVVLKLTRAEFRRHISDKLAADILHRCRRGYAKTSELRSSEDVKTEIKRCASRTGWRTVPRWPLQ